MTYKSFFCYDLSYSYFQNCICYINWSFELFWYHTLCLGSLTYSAKSWTLYSTSWTWDAPREAEEWDEEAWSMVCLWGLAGEFVSIVFVTLSSMRNSKKGFMLHEIVNFMQCLFYFLFPACNRSIYIWSAQNIPSFAIPTSTCFQDQWKGSYFTPKYEQHELFFFAFWFLTHTRTQAYKHAYYLKCVGYLWLLKDMFGSWSINKEEIAK